MGTPASVIGDLQGGAWHSGVRSVIGCPQHVAVMLSVGSQGYRPMVSRRRGGIEPLRVSTPHELKSCPSTSPTHPGPPAQKGAALAQLGAGPLLASRPCMEGCVHITG